MSYVPNASDVNQPTTDKTVESAALEFRAVKTELSRGLKYPTGEATQYQGDLPAAAQRAGKLLGFDSVTGKPAAVANTAGAVGTLADQAAPNTFLFPNTFTAVQNFNAGITGGTAEVNFGSGQFYKAANGNVGIGTTSPGCSLEVNGGVRARGGAPGAGGANNNGYAFTANNGDNDSGMFSSADGRIEFYTDGVERMRVNGGNLQVGHTGVTSSRVFIKKDGQTDWDNRSLSIEDSSGTSSQPGIGFHAAGTTTAGIFKFWGGGSNFECRNYNDTGFVSIAASAFTVSSDYRIKTDVVETGTMLPKVLALRPVNYEKEGANGREYGLIAHEAQECIPELVNGDKDGMRSDGSMELQTVNYMGLTSVLVKTIQEQQALITALTARVTALEQA